ncbi:MAG: imidazoleglycerol-phosphate dehydratase HisB [Syntrophorhabdaceae bacterium]|nr:imidazoleglycerol-phosphate dehydratase HisB [Syntrophorhabdaceae bacterium]
MTREIQVERATHETSIKLSLRLEGKGLSKIDTGIPFFDHMLTLFSRHGLFDLAITGRGDVEVDYHHTIEDIGICLGEAFRKALGDMKGITRFGNAVVPMIEALASVVVDISARPHLVYNVTIKNEKIRQFDVELVEEFFRAFSQSSGVCVHVNVEYGANAHHVVEAVFKAFGRAMSEAVRIDPRVQDIPSTKGVLG